MDATDHLAARIVAGARHTLSWEDAAALIRAHVERENAKLREALTCVNNNIVTFADPTKCPAAYLSPAEVELIRKALRQTR